MAFMTESQWQFIIDNCCCNCGDVLYCGGPSDPMPGGACEIDDDYEDYDEEEF